MSESPRNFGMVCADHAPKPGKFAGQEPVTFVGKYVKLGFRVEDPRPDGKIDMEHMWVRVDREYEGDEDLVGVLDNDPVLPCEYARGDQVAFCVEEIEDMYQEN